MTYEEALDYSIFGNEAPEECKAEYRNMVKYAIIKQIPETPGTDGTHRYCPTCGQYFGKQHPHCWNCGQKLDWGDNKVDNPKSNSDKDGDNNE